MMSWKIFTSNHRFSYFNEKNEIAWKEPWYFIQGADIQFGLIQRYIEKNPVPGWDKELYLAELAVEKINSLQPRPRFFVICGDLCDAMPDDEPELREKQEQDFKKIFSKLHTEIPLICVCGNHDVGDRPSPQSVSKYRSSFGDDFFSFWCGGMLFLVINSQYFYDDRNVQEIAKEHESWLNDQLEYIKKHCVTRVAIFQHIPWFITDPNETESGYFSIRPELRHVWLKKFKEAGIKYIFCGHLHRNAGGNYKDISLVTTSAIGGQLGNDKSGIRVVCVYEKDLKHTYYSFDDVPKEIIL